MDYDIVIFGVFVFVFLLVLMCVFVVDVLFAKRRERVELLSRRSFRDVVNVCG